MNAIEITDLHLGGFGETLHTTLGETRLVTDGYAKSWVAVMVPRLLSTYMAMASLTSAGHHEEMVVLLRRQLEDSVRLHYLSEHQDRMNNIVAFHLLAREGKVLGRIDKAINLATDEPSRSERKNAAAIRRARIKDLEEEISSLGLERDDFPDFDKMAIDLDRAGDLIVYASASEVAHSAISAATDGYQGKLPNGVIRVAVISENPTSRLMHARQAINQTGMAMHFALHLIGLEAEAGTITLDALARVNALAEAIKDLEDDEGRDRSS